MKYGRFALLGICCVFMMLLMSRPAQSKVYKLKFADMNPPGTTCTITGDWWASEVEKRTGGRVKVERFWGGSLVGGYEQLDSVRNGVIDLTWYYSGYHPDIAPLPLIAILPCMNVGPEKVSIAAVDEWMKTNPHIQAELRKNNVKYLFPYNLTHHFLWSKKPVASLDDLKGLRLRTFGPFLALFKDLGCGLVTLPVPEVYDSLERGAVDATTLYISNAVGLRLQEVVKHVTVSELGDNIGSPAVMNLRTWNKLPSDIQEIINKINSEMVDKCAEISGERYKKYMQVVKDAGLTIHRFSPDEEKKIAEVAKDKVWMPYVKKVDSKGIAGTETLEDYLRLLDKYSKKYSR